MKKLIIFTLAMSFSFVAYAENTSEDSGEAASKHGSNAVADSAPCKPNENAPLHSLKDIDLKLRFKKPLLMKEGYAFITIDEKKSFMGFGLEKASVNVPTCVMGKARNFKPGMHLPLKPGPESYYDAAAQLEVGDEIELSGKFGRITPHTDLDGTRSTRLYFGQTPPRLLKADLNLMDMYCLVKEKGDSTRPVTLSELRRAWSGYADVVVSCR